MTRQANAHPRPLTNRTRFLLAVFLLWGAVVIVKLAQLMLIDRDQYLTEMTRRSMFVGRIPSRRGRLLDREGRVLAWSTRHFRLCWEVPRQRSSALRDWARMQSAGISLPTWSESDICERVGSSCRVLEDVDIAAVASPEELMSISGVRLESYFVRRTCPEAQVTDLLGRVTVVEGVEVGMSGAEKAHDALLRGHPGSYRVMLDKHGAWIPETWRKTTELRPGFDVHLPISHPAAHRHIGWSLKPAVPKGAAGG